MRNLCRYTSGQQFSFPQNNGDVFAFTTEVGQCALTPPDPQLKGAWYPGGFKPCTYQVKTQFQNLLSNSTCTATPRSTSASNTGCQSWCEGSGGPGLASSRGGAGGASTLTTAARRGGSCGQTTRPLRAVLTAAEEEGVGAEEVPPFTKRLLLPLLVPMWGCTR
jgi:hypothetical protein